MATGNALPGMNAGSLEIFNDEIAAEAKRSSKATGRNEGNIEDQIRVANELLRGLEVIASTKDKASTEHQQISKLRDGLERLLGEFATAILKGETGLVSATTEKRDQAFNYLVSFLMSFASRAGTRDRLQLSISAAGGNKVRPLKCSARKPRLKLGKATGDLAKAGVGELHDIPPEAPSPRT